MAYQKTGGRSVTVQPTGMPDLSGFFESARQMQEIGNLASSIGTDIRKREYNDLLRQAEIDGATSGAVYKKDKNGKMVLQPLVNFDYEKATQTYSDVDQKTILEAYRKSAIRTYVSAAENDISSAAQNALDNNPNDPNGVRGAFDGFQESLLDLDPQVRAALMPKAVQLFGIAENRALAKQQQEAKENAIYQNSAAYQSKSVEKGKLIASLQDADPAMQDAVFARINEIQEEQDDIVKALELNEVSAMAIGKIRDADRTVVAARVGTNHLQKVYAAEGPVAALAAAKVIAEEAAQNPNLDESVIGQVASQSISALMEMDRLKIKEDTDLRKSIYNDMYARVVIDGLDIGQVMLDPQSDFFKLEGTQQATLLGMSKASTQNIESVVSTANQRLYQDNLAVIKNPNLFQPEEVVRAARNISELRDQGAVGITFKDVVEAKDSFVEASGFYRKGDIQKAGSQIDMELGPMSSYTLEPSYFLQEENLSALEANGVIGKNGYWKSRKEFQSSVESYSTSYQTRLDKVASAQKAQKKLLNNIPVSSSELDNLSEHLGFDKIRIKNEKGQDVSIPMDLLSEDQAIQQLSIDNAANFSVETRGMVHPEAKEIFSRAPYTMQNADLSQRILGQIVSGIRKKTPGTSKDTAVSMFLAQNDFDEKTIGFIRSSQIVGIENAMQSYTVDGDINKNRKINNYISNNGLDKNEFFENTFKKSLVTEKFLTLIQTTISPQNKQMLNEMAAAAGVNNIEGAFIADPYIRSVMENIFYDKISGAIAYEPVAAMQDTIRQIGRRIGVQKNAYTGELEFVQDPILKLAQATVPVVKDTPVVVLGQSNIEFDVRDRIINSFPDALSADQAKLKNMLESLNSAAMEDKTTMHFYANDNYGGNTTYSVYLRDAYGKMNLLSDTYTYDFKSSTAYKETYLEVEKELKTDKAKQFWSLEGLMDKSLVQSTFEAKERARNDNSLNGIVNAWNSFNDATAFSLRSGVSGTVTAKETGGYFGRAEEGDTEVWSVDTLTQEEKNDFFYLIDRMTTLGWR